MPYLLLISEPGEKRRSKTEQDGTQAYEQMLRYGRELRERGLLLAAESLKSDTGGARLTTQGGERSVVDGPFSEAKEIIGGFFLIDCQSREQAIDIAAQCPAAAWATIEVRETGPCFGTG